jgi:cytochrome c oxidase subunit 3
MPELWISDRPSPTPRAMLKARDLPDFAFGPDEPLWWGVGFLCAIEGTVFVLGIAAYYYVALNYSSLPPSRILPPSLPIGTLALVMYLISWYPNYMAAKYAKLGHKPKTKLYLGIAWLTMIACLVIRYFEFTNLHVRWDTTAYGSAVWGLIGLHTFHLITTVGETTLIFIWTLRWGLAPKHRLDVEVNSLYWYFVVGSWTVLYVVIYLSPYLMKY